MRLILWSEEESINLPLRVLRILGEISLKTGRSSQVVPLKLRGEDTKVNAMIQERNSTEHLKVQERDLDRLPQRTFDRSPRPSESPRSGSSPSTDVASGLALVLAIVSFFFSSIAVIQATRARREVQAVLTPPASQPQSGNGASASSASRNRLVPPLVAQRVEPGQFVQPAYGGAGEVELVSVKRAGAAGSSNVVNIEMQVRRLRDRVQGVGDLDLAEVVAINSRTNVRFPTLDFRSPFGNELSLYSLRVGQPVNVSVTVRVPENLNRIDLEVPQTTPFRGVPISSPASPAPDR